jgi:hypothetical protein
MGDLFDGYGSTLTPRKTASGVPAFDEMPPPRGAAPPHASVPSLCAECAHCPRVRPLWTGCTGRTRREGARSAPEARRQASGAKGAAPKDTHGQTIRIAPPLVIRATELDWAVEQLRLVLAG